MISDIALVEKLVLKYHDQDFHNNQLAAVESQNKQAYIKPESSFVLRSHPVHELHRGAVP